MATSDDEENIYTKPGAIRRGGNSSTAVGFYSRGVQPTDVQTSDDYSPPSEDPDILPGEGSSEGGGGNEGGFTPEPDQWAENHRFIDINPTVRNLTRVASLAAPTPVGAIAGVVNAGINLENLSWANDQRERLGLEKLGGWETVKAAAGFSDYTDGKVGTVDIGGQQQEVTFGGGLVGEGPETEQRTSMTAAEALARQAATRSYGTPGRTESGNEGGNAFGTRDDPRAGRGYNSDFSSMSDGNGGGYSSTGNSGRDPNSRDTPSGVSAAEGYGQMADSMSGSGNTNLGGGPSNGGSGGNSGGGSSRVICTELYRQGKISRADWLRDLKYTSAHLSPQHVRGYHAWAIPTVRKMRASKRWTSVWCVLGQARANQIAYLMGDRDKPDCFGAVAKILLEGFCWGVGFFVGDRDAAAELSDGKELN